MTHPKLKEIEDRCARATPSEGGVIEINSRNEFLTHARTDIPKLLRALEVAMGALENQAKCWHDAEMGCLSECSITCVARDDIEEILK